MSSCLIHPASCIDAADTGQQINTLLICIILLTFICPAVSVAQQPPSVPVRVAPAVEIEAAPTIWMPATIIGRDDSKLSAEVNGRLEQVLEVGDRVNKGDIVAGIETMTFDLKVAEARAEIKPIEAKLDFYQRESKRLEQLAQENNAAKNRLDEVTSDYAEYQGQLEVAKTQLAQAKDQLQRAIIRAPFNGVVTERYKSNGERVEAGDEILRLIDTDSLEIQARVTQQSTRYLQTGSILTVSDGEYTTEANIRAIVPVGDDVSRLYELRLTFDNPYWLAGQAVRLAVPTSKIRRFVAVPRDALVIRQDETKIFRINDTGTAELIAVRTGIAQGGMIEVLGDIAPADRIVIRGNERLRPGQSVTIQEEPL